MDVIHRVSFGLKPAFGQRFAEVGIDLSNHSIDEDFVAFDISEKDKRWPKVSALMRELRISSAFRSVFTPEELRSASFCTVDRTWDNGYPQPEDAYLEITYNVDTYCRICGMGAIQRAPFRLTGEPKWGKRSLMALNWIGDEIFTKPDIWAAIFKPFGIKSREVVKNRGGQVLQTCVQLVLDQAAELLIPKEHPSEYCPVCKRTRWDVFKRGFFPKPAHSTRLHMFKSEQWFGTGHMAYKHILVSNDLFHEIEKHKLKGIEFAACAS